MQSFMIVGGGITGLAAAWELSQHVPGDQISVLESAPMLGGKLRGVELAGVRVDVGAESMLARRPEAAALVEEVGLGADIVHPEPASASIVRSGELHPMPAGTMMGVPGDIAALAGLLTDAELQRARAEVAGSAQPSGDVALGTFVASRLGDAVVDRVVEPLLGGVYAGRARSTSLQAALPALLPALREGRLLTEVVRAALPAPVASPAPVFLGVRGGVHRLVTALAERLGERGVHLQTGVTVRELRRDQRQWTVVTGPVPAPHVHAADAVLLATPARPTSRLLATTSPSAGSALAKVEAASMAVITLALDTAGLPDLPGSGLLVPPIEGRTIKASTFSANKWAWVREAGAGAGPQGRDLTFLRLSVGRHGEEATLQVSDAELMSAAVADLQQILDTPVGTPYAWHVQRWGGGLPQYAPGHHDLVTDVLQDVATVPGLEVAGAAYGGVGIPACIASGRAAALRLLDPAAGASSPGAE